MAKDLNDITEYFLKNPEQQRADYIHTFEHYSDKLFYAVWFGHDGRADIELDMTCEGASYYPQGYYLTPNLMIQLPDGESFYRMVSDEVRTYLFHIAGKTMKNLIQLPDALELHISDGGIIRAEFPASNKGA